MLADGVGITSSAARLLSEKTFRHRSTIAGSGGRL
jgi:hypothetical protein